jgi:predicted phosphodiesterase
VKRLLIAASVFLAACNGSDGRFPPEVSLDGEEFAFAAVGDFGTGGSVQSDVAERMCEWHGENTFQLVVTTGDNVYPAGQPESFKEILYEPYDCLVDEGVVFRASLGNHDVVTDNGFHVMNEPLLGMNGERNYVVRIGGVRFVIADSNDLDTDWLSEEIRSEEGDSWTVVLFHHPVFSPGTKHGSTGRFAESLAPLFTEHGVDLVLNGHDHIYSATREVGGVRYVVTGGGGAPLYECGELDVVEVCEERHHFLYVEVRSEQLLVSAVPVEGEPFHTFTIED